MVDLGYSKLRRDPRHITVVQQSMNSIGVGLRASDGLVPAKLECQSSPMMLAEP
jgi:hypothetical protein